jgi:Holliday junction resolvasome RuvABC ATP-dependent DNA helicase subunit
MPIPFPYQIEGGDVRTAQAIIDLLKDGPCSASEICAALGMKSRRHLNGIYIPFLLANRLIKQTLPDKPSSPKQKYSLFEA